MSRRPYPIMLMLAMALPGAVRALGLGDIRIGSGLNEPLSAQIDIVGATRDELAALTASVANREIFQRYGADRPAFLASATFKVGLDAEGRPVLNVRSGEAFTDPLVSFLVDLRWGKNQIVREYSLLLDPPGYTAAGSTSEAAVAVSAAPALVSSPAATPTPPAAPALPARLQAAHARSGAAAVAHEGTAAAERTHHQVTASGTLRMVARRVGARTETQIQRMMVAIFRANPGAFDGNINRMHRHAVLNIPTAAELAAIPTSDAKRDVREQMTAWRLDGRPGAPRLAAAASAPAPRAPAPGASAIQQTPAAVPTVFKAAQAAPVSQDPDGSLKTRVESLEQALGDMHRQLATERARMQTLQDGTARTGGSAELVQVPIVSLGHAALSNSPKPTGSGESKHQGLLAALLVTFALLTAGFIYVRRRMWRAFGTAPVISVIEQPDQQPETAPLSAAVSTPEPASLPRAAAPRSEAISRPTRERTTHAMQSTEPSNMEIDIEALERSYLESLPESATAATATMEQGDIEQTAETAFDALAIEPADMEITGIDPMDIDTAVIRAGLNTVVMNANEFSNPPAHPPAIDSTTLDYDLLDLDATAQHVQMPSGLHDHPVVSERRMNIVDVLKMAIDRDPHRHDLRMKLLETYYSTAATNQRAFMEVVRKVAREPGSFSPEDWNKVTMMGREIAADDILFAGDLKDDLAHCA
jgi:pilus assembly protein FimV